MYCKSLIMNAEKNAESLVVKGKIRFDMFSEQKQLIVSVRKILKKIKYDSEICYLGKRLDDDAI